MHFMTAYMTGASQQTGTAQSLYIHFMHFVQIDNLIGVGVF
jgi:hypothetical protein